MFLVDTCALSELVRPHPTASVFDWFQKARPRTLFISALTLGEIRKGVERMAPGRRRDQIATWMEGELALWFEGQTLAVDSAVADQWGRLAARLPQLPTVDGLIAATALRHGLSVVTRNESDFAPTGVRVVNPWRLEG